MNNDDQSFWGYHNFKMRWRVCMNGWIFFPQFYRRKKNNKQIDNRYIPWMKENSSIHKQAHPPYIFEQAKVHQELHQNQFYFDLVIIVVILFIIVSLIQNFHTIDFTSFTMMKSSQGSSTAGDHQNLQQQHSNTDKNGHSNTSIKVAKFIARHPYKCFFATLLLTFIITGIAAMSGLEVSIDSTGWRSRNTLIAKREMQNEIIVRFKNELFQGELVYYLFIGLCCSIKFPSYMRSCPFIF